MTDEIVPITGRRSGLTNPAPAHLQSIFIESARTAMGQPDEEDATWCLGKLVTITFNHEREPVTGTITHIIRHPSTWHATYLVLDHDEKNRLPLNSIQSIELVDLPLALTQGEEEEERDDKLAYYSGYEGDGQDARDDDA